MVNEGKLAGGIVGYLLAMGITITLVIMAARNGGFNSPNKTGKLLLFSSNVVNVLYFFIITSLLVYAIADGAYDDPDDPERSKLGTWLWSVSNLIITLMMLFFYFNSSKDGSFKGWAIWYVVELIIVLIVMIAAAAISASK